MKDKQIEKLMKGEAKRQRLRAGKKKKIAKALQK
jgi:hypothetical protein